MVRIPSSEIPKGVRELQLAEILDVGIKRDNPGITQEEAWRTANIAAVAMEPLVSGFLDGGPSFFDARQEIDGITVRLTNHRIEGEL